MSTVLITAKLLKSNVKYSIDNGLPVTLTDSELRGLSARISPTGRVTWIASKSIGRGKGSTQRVVLGHYPGMSLDQARIEAGQTISRLARGEDVHSQVKQAKRAKRERLQCPTIKDAAQDYLREWSAKTRRSASGAYEKSVRLRFDNIIIPELGASTRINAVTKADIRSLLKTRKDAGRFQAARSLFAQLRPFFDWCLHEEYISISPCVGVQPPDAAKERQHKLTDAEIKALLAVAIPYFKVLLLTAQRRTEVASIQWSELNLDKGEWVIPSSKTKNGREHLVPLSPAVVAILRSLPQRKPSEYAFGKYPDAPFSGFSKATRELQADMLSKLRESDTEAAQSDWRIHDLRRTAASGMASIGIQPHVIEAVLNHTPVKLQRTYQVYLYAKEKKEALQVWADHIAKISTYIHSADNVVSLRA
jgi:integrase